jgi:TetR/AcrR family transcriptional regulator, cholesterol catabolism regulator
MQQILTDRSVERVREQMAVNRDDNVKEKIVDTSIKLFLKNGFVGTSMKELTDAVGVARGTIYWYFKSKDRILEEVLDKVSREVYDVAYERVNACEGNFLTKFKTLYRFLSECAVDKRELLLVSTTVVGEVAETGTEAEKKIKDMQMKFHRFIKTLLDEGQGERIVRADLDTGIQAHIMIGNLIGMHLQWCLHGNTFDADAYAKAFREAVLRALLTEEMMCSGGA